MSTSCTKYIIGLLLLGPLFGFSQKHLEMFTENIFSINHDFSDTYSTNFELGTRAFLYTNQETLFKTRQLELSHFSTLRLNLKSSISLGLKLRNRDWFEDSSSEIRLTQQFNTKTLLSTLRFGHRFRSEQRFYEDETVFRYRYRLALDVPLQGLKLDVGETYFVLYNEALWSISKISKPEFEYRISPSIGILLSKDLNLELGLEYRLDKLNMNTDHELFFNTSLDLKL